VEIRQLKTFRAVAQLMSFNRAADRLGYAQSSVSAQIQALEEELGVRLFDRLGRRIVLTQAGETLERYAARMLDLAEETLAQVASETTPRGSLTIRVPESLGVCRLPPVVRAFQQQNPEVRLRLVTCAHDGLKEDLRRGLTDLAFLLAEAVVAPDLDAEVLGFESVVLVAPPGHPLVSRRLVSTRDLAGQTFLVSTVDCSYLKTFRRILDEEGVSLSRVLEFSSVATLKECAAHGGGITLLPEMNVGRELAEGRLALVPWSEGRLEVAILMAWHKERWVSPTLKAFMDAARARLLGPRAKSSRDTTAAGRRR
jgi:DNA-binding transcriptional LysR family regulator